MPHHQRPFPGGLRRAATTLPVGMRTIVLLGALGVVLSAVVAACGPTAGAPAPPRGQTVAAVPAPPPAYIGYLSSNTEDWPGPPLPPRVDGFRQGLRELGYIEGHSIVIEYRFADGARARVPQLAAELVSLGVQAIVLADSGAIRPAVDATDSIPLVMTISSDPVDSGFVASLRAPGGNVTGLTTINAELDGKRLQLLTQLVPDLQRVAVLWERTNVGALSYEKLEAVARTLSIQLVSLGVEANQPIEPLLVGAREEGAGALMLISSPRLGLRTNELVQLAQQHRLPTIAEYEQWAKLGGLMAYSPHVPDLYRRAASYVDRILKGADPATTPVELPTRFDLTLNLRTAAALGLTIPPSVLQQATEVID